MIKLERGIEPNDLKIKQKEWTDELLASVKLHGSYKNIPPKEKDKLVSKYRLKSVKNELKRTSYKKCAYCESKPEETGHIAIEHFIPKSQDPKVTFQWVNFLPSCSICNENKSDHDVLKDPIINPYDIDPNTIIKFSANNPLKLVSASKGSKQLAEMTIEVCGLNTLRLYKPRSELLTSFTEYEDSIAQAIDMYDDADTLRKRSTRKRKIKEAISAMALLTEPNEKHSKFCSELINKSEIYQTALALVNS